MANWSILDTQAQYVEYDKHMLLYHKIVFTNRYPTREYSKLNENKMSKRDRDFNKKTEKYQGDNLYIYDRVTSDIHYTFNCDENIDKS